MNRLFWALNLPGFSCQVQGHILIEEILNPYFPPPLKICVRYWQSWRLVRADLFVSPESEWWNAVIAAAEPHIHNDNRARDLVDWMAQFGPRRHT